MPKRLVLLLFGAPGCGKGTQSRLITDWLGIPGISTGEMLRAEIKAGSELGREAKAVIDDGKFVSDDLINRMVAERIAQPDCQNGFMLDGYPRTVEQAEYLDVTLVKLGFPPAIVLHFDVPKEALVHRIVSRRQCPKCGRIYNVLSAAPKVSGVCDDDGTPLITRPDDREEVFRERLQTYIELTRPILAHYYSHPYFQIQGDRSTQYVFEEIVHALEPIAGKPGPNHQDD